MRESIAAIIASVEPQVTTRFVSGSASIPLNVFARRAIASRNSRAPQVIEYWLYPPSSARFAAAVSCEGGSKSGNPWAKFTASWSAAIRVISRMTDSGNFCTRSATRRSRIAMSSRTAERGVGIDAPRVERSARAKTCRTTIKSAHPHARRPRTADDGAVLRFLAGRRLHGHAAHRESARRVPEGDRPLDGRDGGHRARDEPLRDDVRLPFDEPRGPLPQPDLHAGRRDPVRRPSVDRHRVRRGDGRPRPSPGRVIGRLPGTRIRRAAARNDLRMRPGQEGHYDPGRAIARGRDQEYRAARIGPRSAYERRWPERSRPPDCGDRHPVPPGPPPIGRPREGVGSGHAGPGEGPLEVR